MRIGPIPLSSPFCQAGLAGYSDRAMRLVARRRGCPYAVTEALLDTIMLSGGKGLANSIDIDEEDHPVAGQVIGSEPETMAAAARILHEHGYDVVDLNFACPVKKIKNKARGGHMLQDVPRAVSILRAVRAALPGATLTVSLRRAFDDSAESVERFERVLDEAWEQGFAAARVHARTVEQKYNGRADWSALREVKRRNPTRTILGSGDVFTAEDAVRMLRETGVDLVWIARGAIGNPWIFGQAATLLEGSVLKVQGSVPDSVRGSTFDVGRWTFGSEAGTSNVEHRTSNVERPSSLNPEPRTLNPPSIHAQRDALLEHFSIAMEIHGEQLAGRRMRKQGIKYARFHPEAEAVKAAFIATGSLRQWKEVLDRFYAADGPGVWPAPDAVDEVNDEASSCAAG